ncbi:MAG: hypothetical protein EOM68_07205 [Spirochaetia bacterium]|nr:hypothetical protein [Spirochaetia bacterium]
MKYDNQASYLYRFFSLKVSATVIAALIISLGAAGATFMSDKVSKEEFEKHCREMDDKQRALQEQFNNQLQVNAEMLKALNRIDLKVQEVKTNTEWLMKERDKK